jgi:hypothetical protein
VREEGETEGGKVARAHQLRTRTSLMTAGMSGVRLWQMVTVAFSCWRRVATGTPTMLERPRTTARRPSMGIL